MRFCPDEWPADLWAEAERARLEAKQWELAQRLLALGVDVVIEFGSWSRSERDELRLGARELVCAVELRYLDVPLDELVRRVEARNDEPGETTMTRAHLEEWAGIIEVPDAEELALFDTPLA